jgi:hypothetical protein
MSIYKSPKMFYFKTVIITDNVFSFIIVIALSQSPWELRNILSVILGNKRSRFYMTNKK